jgi:hypothetical protein
MVNNNDGTCTVPQNNCTNGYYLNSFSNCSLCYPTCQTCKNGGQSDCLTCFSGFTLTLGTCIKDCNATSYYNLTCLPCINVFTNCYSCNSTSCNQCNTGFILQNGTCNINCPSGNYQLNSQCLPCPNYCLTCTSFSYCTACVNTTFIIYNNLCY